MEKCLLRCNYTSFFVIISVGDNMKKRLFLLFIFISLFLVGCTKQIGYADKDKKKSYEEIKQYSINTMKEKYNIDIEIIELKEYKMEYCKGSIDGSCIDKEYVKDASSYTLTCKTKDNVTFTITYTDAYTDTKEKKYHDIELEDDYDITIENNKYKDEIKKELSNILFFNGINGELYEEGQFNDAYKFVVLINQKDLSKMNKLYEDMSSYIYNFCKKYEEKRKVSFKINYVLSDDVVMEDIRRIEKKFYFSSYIGNRYVISDIVYESNIKKYDMDINKYNEYKSKKQCSHYVYELGYSYDTDYKEKVYIYQRVLGLDKK